MILPESHVEFLKSPKKIENRPTLMDCIVAPQQEFPDLLCPNIIVRGFIAIISWDENVCFKTSSKFDTHYGEENTLLFRNKQCLRNVTEIWYFLVLGFSLNSVRLFDEQFLTNCEPVDGSHPAPPPPGICLPHQCTVGKKVLRFSWKIHQELKTIDFLNVFTIPRCSIFRVF